MIHIQQKLEAIHEGFKELDFALKPEKLDKYILSRLGAGVRTEARRAVKRLVVNRTGAMQKGVYTYYDKKKREQVVTNNAQRIGTNGKPARYPWILAAGKRLDTRSGKMLHFGERDWVEGPGNKYVWSNKADDDIEKVINRELDKLKKKGVLA